MLHILTSEANRDNDELEGFGSRWANDEFWGKRSGNTNFGEIPPNGWRSVTFKPLFGLFNQPKYIPLMWSPLTLEFEVVNGATDPLVGRNASADYTDADTSITWQLQDVRIVCDLVTLDSALQNSYAEHVLSGEALPINYGSYVSQFQTITGGDFAVSVTRGVSRLKSVFLTFDGDHATQNSTNKLLHNHFNTFAGPMAADFTTGTYDYSKELQWQLQIGSKMFPEYPCRSLAETFYQLKKALGIHGSA